MVKTLVRGDARELALSVGPIFRVGQFYWGAEPRMPFNDIEWVDVRPRVTSEDVLTLVSLHWTLLMGIGPRINWIDPRAKCLLDGGPAFLRMVWRRDSLIVKARPGSPWSLLFISMKDPDGVVDALRRQIPDLDVR